MSLAQGRQPDVSKHRTAASVCRFAPPINTNIHEHVCVQAEVRTSPPSNTSTECDRYANLIGSNILLFLARITKLFSKMHTLEPQ